MSLAQGGRSGTVDRPTPLPARFKATPGVYALVDPRTNRVMYVGQSLDIDYRYRQHLDPNVHCSNVAKVRWVAGLKNLGLAPRLVVLAECEWPQSDTVESEYIRMYKISGQCELNVASGGKQSRGVSKAKNAHQDDWFQLGRKVKVCRELLAEIGQDAAAIAGPKAMAEAIETTQALRKFVAKMEARLMRAYPEWEDIATVFYGSDE